MKEKILELANFLYSKKALDIVALDVSELTVITDGMLIASGRNNIQVKTLAEDLLDHTAELGFDPVRKEGLQDGQWVILDYGDILVHIFHAEQRAFYKLDKLWLTENNRIELPFDAMQD